MMAHLIEVFLHLDKYLDSVLLQYGVWIYVLLFVVIFLETGVVVTPFLPGDSLLFTAGALCARGDLAVGWLFLLLWLAAVLGDTVNYSIGHIVGPRAFHGQHRFFKREHLDRTHQFYERHGGKTIVLARFIPIIRTFAPVVAGVGQMEYWRFVTYNVLGGVGWVWGLLWTGYLLGQTVPDIGRHVHIVIGVVVLLSVLPIGLEYWKARRRRRAALAAER